MHTFAATGRQKSELGSTVEAVGSTVGAVDLGGSSLEVSFVLDDPHAAEAQGEPFTANLGFVLY